MSGEANQTTDTIDAKVIDGVTTESSPKRNSSANEKRRIGVNSVDVCGTSVDANADVTEVTSDDTTGADSETLATDARFLPCLPSKSDREQHQEKEVSKSDREPHQEKENSSVPTVSYLSDHYDMTHKSRGHALIINQEQFSHDLRRQGYTRRTGTAVDEKNIHQRLKQLGFNVTSYPDLTGNQMKTTCAKFADKDHSDCDCFVCVILSHGEEGIVFGTDKSVEIKELSDYFKGDRCPSLMGKPKIFIIQACRGYQTDPGVPLDVRDAKGDQDEAATKVPDTIKLPIEADFLFAYSTVPGYYSWRNGANGSWFIQALCEILEKTENSIEIRKLLTLTNKKVAQHFKSWNPDNESFHKMKQIPCITSMLTKDLVLTKKKKRFY